MDNTRFVFQFINQVDFATNTNEMFDAGTEPDIEIESRRTSEKATSITKDTGEYCCGLCLVNVDLSYKYPRI